MTANLGREAFELRTMRNRPVRFQAVLPNVTHLMRHGREELGNVRDVIARYFNDVCLGDNVPMQKPVAARNPCDMEFYIIRLW